MTEQNGNLGVDKNEKIKKYRKDIWFLLSVFAAYIFIFWNISKNLLLLPCIY